MFQRTLTCLRRARITVPQLSPTHSKAKIVRWCLDVPTGTNSNQVEVQPYDPLFILQCSPDLVTEGYRQSEDHEPFMIVEAHDEGVLTIDPKIELNQWYDVGTPIGEIDDGDHSDPTEDGDWLWQAYSHDEE